MTANTSPSEDEEDGAEFYDAQESETFTLSIPSGTTGNSILRERNRNDSQGSDDGSSSEGDAAPMSHNNTSRGDSFLIVTDSTAAVSQSAEISSAKKLDNVSPYRHFTHPSLLDLLQFIYSVNIWLLIFFFRLPKNLEYNIHKQKCTKLFVKMYSMYICNQKFDLIRISVLSTIKERKNQEKINHVIDVKNICFEK